MVERRQNQVRDIELRPKPTRGRNPIRAATPYATNVLDEAEAAADKAAVADAAAVIAAAEMIVIEATRAVVEIAEVTSRATATGRRAISS